MNWRSIFLNVSIWFRINATLFALFSMPVALVGFMRKSSDALIKRFSNTTIILFFIISRRFSLRMLGIV